MKKITSALFFATIITLSMIGCSQETELRWANDSSQTVNTIQWINSGEVDQTWNDTAALADGSTNDFKKVNKLNGEGQCWGGTDTTGTLYDIQVNGTTDTFAQLSEGSSETLTISGLATK